MRMTVLLPALLAFALVLPACDPDADGDGFPASEDCNDDNANVYPEAPDFRGDGCDADCGTQTDADGDDWPDDQDCDAEDPTIYPCAVGDVAGDSVDGDCDGFDEPRNEGCNPEDPTIGEGTIRLSPTCDPA